MKDYQNIIGQRPKNVIGRLTPADNGQLEKKETQAIELIRTIHKQRGIVWLAYSGGKDSEVIYHLCKKAGVEFTAFYNNTTIDKPGTIKWIKSHENVLIMPPKHSFYYLLQHRGFPSFQRRFCCDKLKERYVVPYYLTGVRQAESKRRADKYKEPEMCMRYTNGKRAQVYMPILFWSDSDIEQYINAESIKCHPLYYDPNGNFCVKRRLGCLGCPLPYDRGRADFMKYPNMVKAWCNSMAIYRNTRPTLTKMVASFADEYENFYFHLFLQNLKQLHEMREGIWNWNPRELLEDYFSVELPPAKSPLSDIQKRLTTANPNTTTHNITL